jgi:sirohydrochlorin ferrochelatase
MKLGMIIVDHGSRGVESNRSLESVVDLFAERFGETCDIVEPAHMELAEPTLSQAFARCVTRGADTVVVSPFFLGPGRHIREDIPRLVAEAAERFPQIRHIIAEPLGVHELILDVLAHRAAEALQGQVGSKHVVLRN